MRTRERIGKYSPCLKRLFVGVVGQRFGLELPEHKPELAGVVKAPGPQADTRIERKGEGNK